MLRLGWATLAQRSWTASLGGRPIEIEACSRAGALALTGERTLPGIAEENYWFRRHEAGYLALVPHVAGRLLEIGAGEGYGTSLLAGRAEFSCAIDYDQAAISHLAGRYPGLNPIRANLAALPVRTDQVDTIACLQVIEHVWDHRQFLDECARVLRPGGQLLLSTPNRLTFSPDARPGQRPLNPFHTHEFTAEELLALIGSAGFTEVGLHGLHPSDRLVALDERYRSCGGFVAAQLAGPPLSWPAGLRADVASVTAADFVVSSTAPASSLDLIVLAQWS